MAMMNLSAAWHADLAAQPVRVGRLVHAHERAHQPQLRLSVRDRGHEPAVGTHRGLARSSRHGRLRWQRSPPESVRGCGRGTQRAAARPRDCLRRPWTIALARYLPFGEPDSRRWLAPDEARTMLVPSDQHFGCRPVGHASRRCTSMASTHSPSCATWCRSRTRSPISATNSYGAYRFPFAPWILEYEERFKVKAHPLDHHHRNASGNRFAYDIGVVRLDGRRLDYHDLGRVSDRQRGAARVRARRARGRRRQGRRLPAHSAGQPAGVIDSTDANFVTIQHAFDPFDRTKAEFISYLHFQQDSVPLDLCPNICPEDAPAVQPRYRRRRSGRCRSCPLRSTWPRASSSDAPATPATRRRRTCTCT